MIHIVKKSILLAVFCSMPLLDGYADESAGSLESLDSLVKQWVELRSAIADEKRGWQDQKAQWEAEIMLLQKEKGILEKEIAEDRESLSSVELDQEQMLHRQQYLQQLLEELEPLLDRMESELLAFQERVPASLLPSLKPLFRALPKSSQEAAGMEVAERAQRVLALAAAIEQLQNQFHVTHEMLNAVNGKRRQTDVIYFGLAQAYAVSPNDDWAAVGNPTSTGWAWQERPELAERIRCAIRVKDRDQLAELVALPLTIETEDRP